MGFQLPTSTGERRISAINSSVRILCKIPFCVLPSATVFPWKKTPEVEQFPPWKVAGWFFFSEANC